MGDQGDVLAVTQSDETAAVLAVELVEQHGMTFRPAAACLNVSVATAWE
jgi:hypothetical protein